MLDLSEADRGYYNSNIQPLQQQLLQQTLNPATINQEVAQAKTDVGQQFANLPGAFQRQAAGSGIALTGAQKANFAKQAALNAGIATAGAANQTRAAAGQRQAAIVGY